MNGVLLLGSTDVTLAVADATLAVGVEIAGIVSVGGSFHISYSQDKVQNSRQVDISGWCLSHGIRHINFSSYDDVSRSVAQKPPILCLAAGWYHMVPRRFRLLFPRGCFGFHASLLPQLRGGAPLNWAILTGLRQTGVTLFELTDGVDDGMVFGQEQFEIASDSLIGELVAYSRDACRRLTENCLPALLIGALPGRQQEGAPTYGLQRRPEDGRIDWCQNAETIDRLVRAVSRPYPGAFSILEGEQIRIWRAYPAKALPKVFGQPGQIVRLGECSDPCVVTGDGLLAIREADGADGHCYIDKLRRSGHKHFGS